MLYPKKYSNGAKSTPALNSLFSFEVSSFFTHDKSNSNFLPFSGTKLNSVFVVFIVSIPKDFAISMSEYWLSPTCIWSSGFTPISSSAFWYKLPVLLFKR